MVIGFELFVFSRAPAAKQRQASGPLLGIVCMNRLLTLFPNIGIYALLPAGHKGVFAKRFPKAGGEAADRALCSNRAQVPEPRADAGTTPRKGVLCRLLRVGTGGIR